MTSDVYTVECGNCEQRYRQERHNVAVWFRDLARNKLTSYKSLYV